jgi:glyoxylase-like metal-dependent hydrolase (beta-lactamase superfamily II)
MREVLPGVWEWSWMSPEKQMNFNGHIIVSGNQRIMVDPPLIAPEAEAKMPKEKITSIVITNRDHVRETEVFRKRFGVKVLVPEADAPMMEIPIDGTFKGGDSLTQELHILSVEDGKTPGESALYLERGQPGGVLILGDALIGHPPGQLSLLPADKFADVARAKQGVRRINYLPFFAVLVGDGKSILKNGSEAVQRFLEQA